MGSADHCTTAADALLLPLLLAAGRGGGGGVVASCQLCGSAADVESATSIARHCCHLPGGRGRGAGVRGREKEQGIIIISSGSYICFNER